jgi:FtsH-binding integral membrane protein
MSFYAPEPYQGPRRSAARTRAADRADARAIFGRVMTLVAMTCIACAAGAYLGRDLSAGAGFLAFLVAFGTLFGLRAAAGRSHELAVFLLLAIGLLLGLGLGPVVAYYARTQPDVVYQSAAATGLFIGGFGAYGYATRRDLSAWSRTLFWLLIALIVFGLVSLFVTMPGGHVLYAALGLAVFAALTIFDFNRLRRQGLEDATLIAASIFLDILNVFQFMLMLFGGRDDRG